MDEHIAVLRELREDFRELMHGGELVAAIDHAIAACEELEDLKEDNADYARSLLFENEARVRVEAERDALVARLGECLRLHGKWCETGSRTDKAVFVNEADQLFIDHADDLARVVKETSDG